MAARKRLRNTEELSPPASKQQKIDDFLLPQGETPLTFTISTSNRFSPLTLEENTPLAPSENEGGTVGVTNNAVSSLSLPTRSPINLDSEELATTSQPTSREGDITCKACLRSVSDTASLCNLVARTLSNIYSEIKKIQMNLDSLCKQSSEQHAMDSAHRTENKGELKLTEPSAPFTLNANKSGSIFQSTFNTQHVNHQQLILENNKICLNIFYYNGCLPVWNSLSLAKRHLSVLLKIRAKEIDLISVESINASNYLNDHQRVLLTFVSPVITKELWKRRITLKSKGILPSRVFHNIIVSPLVPNLSKRRLNPDLELPDTSANRKLMGEVQFEVNPRDPSLHSMAQDLNHSPGKWDHTRNRLLEQTNLEQTTPSEPYGNKISQELYICPPKTLPASTVMEDLCIPPQLAPQHSLELPQMDYELDFHLFKDLQLGSQQDTKGKTWAQELSELMEKPHPSASSAIRSSPDGDIEGTEIIEVHNNGDSRSSATNNCCVFLDPNKSLEKLIELD